MIVNDIGRLRLANQSIAASNSRTPEQVVSALGAMQAQDYSGALWSIGLRLPNATEAEVERAVKERKIVRSWPMRGTLHFVAATDLRWMLELLTPRVLANATSRSERLGVDAKTLARCEKIFVRELAGNRQLTREALVALLEQNNISTQNNRSYHIFWCLAQLRVICFAAREGKQHAFALFDEWIPNSRKFERDAALAELARRYFTSHGPATLQDFIGWSGLKAADARAGVEGAAKDLTRETIGGKVYWLPPTPAQPQSDDGFLLSGFDEFILGYKDRSAVLDSRHSQKIIPGNNGVFAPTIVLDGRVVGTWQRAMKKTLVLTLSPFKRFTKAELKALAPAAERYSRFLGLPVELR